MPQDYLYASRMAYEISQRSDYAENLITPYILNISKGSDRLFYDDTLNSNFYVAKPPKCVPADRTAKLWPNYSNNWSLNEVYDVSLKGRYPIPYLDDIALRDTVYFSGDHDRFYYQVLLNELALNPNIPRPFRDCGRKACSGRHFDTAIVLTSNWQHYGHFLTEHLLKLRHVQNALGDQFSSVSCVVESPCPIWKKELLRLCGVSESQIVEWSGETSKVDRLIVPSYPKFSFDNFSWLKNKILESIGMLDCSYFNYDLPRKVFLSRNSGKFTRKVVNFEKLQQFLISKGFTIVDCERLSIIEQVKLFRNVECVIAPHGSSLANILFSKKINIIEMFNQEVPTAFYTLANMMGHTWHGVYEQFDRRSNLIVDIDNLNNTLNSKILT